jgi:hypothetical protein
MVTQNTQRSHGDSDARPGTGAQNGTRALSSTDQELEPIHRYPKPAGPSKAVDPTRSNDREPTVSSIEVLSPDVGMTPRNAAEFPRGFDYLIQCFRAYVDAHPDRFRVQVRHVGGKRIHVITLATEEQN